MSAGSKRLPQAVHAESASEIGKALEEELAGRIGNPAMKSIPEIFPELPKGDTRDVAAKAAGFGSGKQPQLRAILKA